MMRHHGALEGGSGRRALPILVGALVLGGVAGTAWLLNTFVFSDAWSRQQIDLVSWVDRPDNPQWPYLDVVDMTDAVCGPMAPCVQAVGNRYLTLLKFDGVESARRYAEPLGPTAQQIDPLVIQFNGEAVSETERADVIHAVSGINARSPD